MKNRKNGITGEYWEAWIHQKRNEREQAKKDWYRLPASNNEPYHDIHRREIQYFKEYIINWKKALAIG
ncbi:hypothetical protein [Paenibacillus marinisediminis]